MTENIRIAIRDSTDSFNIGFFDNEAGIKYHVADLNRFLAGSASILTLRYYSKDIDTIRTGCKLSFFYKGKDYWLNILDIKKTGFNVELTAFSTNLEANNELVSPYKATVAETIVSYIKRFDAEKSFVIGINEVPDKTIKLEWTVKETVLARLYSVANNFDAELEFVTELNDDYSLKRHMLNIYKKGNVGSVINSPVRVGKDLKVINYEESINELYTAVRGKGKDGLTIAGLNKKVYDDKGNLLYYSNSDTVYAPQSRDRYPSIGKQTDDGYTLMLLDDSEYSTKEDQYAYMLGRLKDVSQPKVTFTAEGGFAGEIGDTRILIDDIHYEPELYVQARIIETVESILTEQTSKTVFSNFERKYSQLSDDLLKRVEELAKEVMPYTLELATNNGTVFKNGAGNSQITPNLKRGSETISGASFVWTINGTSTTASTYTVTADAVSGTAVVKVEAVLAGKAVASTEITFTNVADGRDGRDGKDGIAGKDGVGLRATSVTYGLSFSGDNPTYIMDSKCPNIGQRTVSLDQDCLDLYDNSTETGYQKTYISKDGNNGTDGIAGKDGVGITSTSITYARSTSGTSAPSSGWTSAVPSVPAGEFLWTKTVWNYTDNTSETGYSVAKMGEAGPKGEDGQGSRNYAEDYRFERGLWEYHQGDSSTRNYKVENGVYQVTGSTLTWRQYQIFSKTGSRANNNNSSTALAELEAGKKITVSFRARCVAGNPNIFVALRENRKVTAGGNPDRIRKEITLTNEWATYTATTDSLVISPEFDYWRIILGYMQIGTVEFEKVELVVGGERYNIGPAVEDLNARIESKADSQLTQEQLVELTDQTNRIQANMEALAAAKALTDLEKAYKEYVRANDDAKRVSEGELATLKERTAEHVTKLAKFAKDWEFMTTKLRIAEEGIYFGKLDGSSEIKITDDRISFWSSEKEVMWITAGVLNIDNGIFTVSVQVGRFREEQYTTNPDINVIRYVG